MTVVRGIVFNTNDIDFVHVLEGYELKGDHISCPNYLSSLWTSLKLWIEEDGGSWDVGSSYYNDQNCKHMMTSPVGVHAMFGYDVYCFHASVCQHNS